MSQDFSALGQKAPSSSPFEKEQSIQSPNMDTTKNEEEQNEKEAPTPIVMNKEVNGEPETEEQHDTTDSPNNDTTSSENTESKVPQANESTSKLSFKERVAVFQECINAPLIDFKKARELSFQGIPDYPGLRSIYWKLLLSYLPNDRSKWEELLKRNRDLYQSWLEELMIDPHKQDHQDDHPLSQSTTSTWALFFKDKDLIEEIDKDVKRTLPHLHFFNHDPNQGSTQHYQALKRILFVYAKLNPGIRYVQGMNEILGPIYYIFASDTNASFSANAESDAFFCFTNLMAEIRDNFIKTLDKSTIGIQGLILKLNSLLKVKDPELWQNFEDKSINPQFYSFRWLTLLLSQEFDLPDVLRLWDSLFSDKFRFDFLFYVCCAMIIIQRERLLDGSFADNLKLLQSYPLTDINVVIHKALEIQSDEYTPPPPRPTPPVIQMYTSSTPTQRATKRESAPESPAIGLASNISSFLKIAQQQVLARGTSSKKKSNNQDSQQPQQSSGSIFASVDTEDYGMEQPEKQATEPIPQKQLPVPPKPFDYQSDEEEQDKNSNEEKSHPLE